MYNEDKWGRETDDESFWSDAVEFQYFLKIITHVEHIHFQGILFMEVHFLTILLKNSFFNKM